MVGFLRVVKEILFRLKLYLLGIRFYESKGVGDNPLVYEAEYRIDKSHTIKFKFYRVECTDMILRRGHLVEEQYKSFIVQAFLDDRFPLKLRGFDTRSFFFNGKTNDFGKSEQETLELILDVYLDFLKTWLSCNHCKKQTPPASAEECARCKQDI